MFIAVSILSLPSILPGSGLLGFVPGLYGLYGLLGLTEVPGFLSFVPDSLIGLYFAVTLVSSFTVILSPTFLASPFTSQPANSFPAGAVKPSLFGNV